MRSRTVLPVVTAILLIGGSMRAQQPTFRSGAAAVVVDVNVRDRTGRPVTRLGIGDFELFDAGVRQQVDDISYGKVPIDVTVALDISHSVSGATLNRLRQAVVQLMRDLENDDRLKLVLFNMQIVRTLDFSRDVQAVETAIRTAVAAGGTALLDTLSVALVSASAPERRQLMVAFTDGHDSSSTTTPDLLKRVVERTRATLTLVMPGTNRPMVIQSPSPALPPLPTIVPSVQRGPLEGFLTELSRDTGGSVLRVTPGANLTATFSQSLADFRSTYVLYYTPRGVDRAGYHTIDVKVRKDGATVRARRGYFGG